MPKQIKKMNRKELAERLMQEFANEVWALAMDLRFAANRRDLSDANLQRIKRNLKREFTGVSWDLRTREVKLPK